MYFIGNFQHLTSQQEESEQERRHGDFSMMVAADSMQDALDKFRQRLIAFRESTTFFEGRCTVYLSQVLEFENFPNREAVMLNFKSFAGDPVMPFIACMVPTEQNNACSIHEWHGNRPVTEGQKDRRFMEFD